MPTEAKDIFEATSRSLREFLNENGLGLYIPPYQRPYSWADTKVDQLLESIVQGYVHLFTEDDSFTFLGTVITIHDIEYKTVQPIVRDQVPAKVLTVIDGQQRLTTLTLLLVALHNHMHRRAVVAFKKALDGYPEDAFNWLSGQTQRYLNELRACIYEDKTHGDSPLYPRLIRAFVDQWSTRSASARYESPIAHLVATYAASIQAPTTPTGQGKVSAFKPALRAMPLEGETDLLKRYDQIQRLVDRIARDSVPEQYEEVPAFEGLATATGLQRALLGHQADEQLKAIAADESSANAKLLREIVRLILFSAYVLNRIALTVVRGKNEDYAFTIFESLNTTGEPLTAFETFKPRVVAAEGIENYETSVAREQLDTVSSYLARYEAGNKQQAATSDLLIAFALAETGEKLSKRLPDQRRYLKEQYDRHIPTAEDREAFVQHLSHCATFFDSMWEPRKGEQPHLLGLPPDATTDSIKLCTAFLRELKHSISVPLMLRYYSAALISLDNEDATNLQRVIRAITAFSVFWRGSRRTTENIDKHYRELMSGSSAGTQIPRLARVQRTDDGFAFLPSASALQAELRRRLDSAGGIATKDDWLRRASDIPLYTVSRPLARFLLLAAYHDSVPDPDSPGLIMNGRPGCSPCLTFDGLSDDRHLTLEHIAPQGAKKQGGWSDDLYGEDDVVNSLGNLVLLPALENSSLGARPWEQKRLIYAALGAASPDQARALIERANRENGSPLAESTEELVGLAKHMPHLEALGARTGPWDRAFVQERSNRLLSLAWDRLSPWLGFEAAP